MKVLLINGSPHREGCTAAALSELAASLQKSGIETDSLWLGNKPVQDCISCFGCKRNGGACVFQDDVNTVLAQLDSYDGIVAGSPVYSGGPCGRIVSFLDRLTFACPEGKLAGKLAASVVSARRAGTATAFDRLNKYWLINNMIVVGSQYWNQVHGLRAEDVQQDEEGLQTMRTLGRNMAWLLKSIDAGRRAGIAFPVYEEHISTNFTR